MTRRPIRLGGRHIWIAATTAFVVLLAGGGAFAWRALGSSEGEARQAAERFARAWSSGNLGQVGYGNVAAEAAAAAYKETVTGLGAESVAVRVEQVSLNEGEAEAQLAVSWKLTPNIAWRYNTTLPLSRTDGSWAPLWRPTVVHPKLQQGASLVTEREQPRRAEIRARNGKPIVEERPVVRVGVVPGKVSAPAKVADSLRQVLDIDAKDLPKRIRQAGDDAFVQVITLRKGDFQPLEKRLRALPGVAWRTATLPLAPTRQFAGALLGRSGPATAEIIKESGGRYVSGDVAGLSGMQRRYDARLAGTAGIRVLAVPPEGAKDDGDGQGEQEQQDGQSASSGRTELFAREATAGTPVRTTLDPKVQRAADAALSSVKKKSALVAVHVPSGDVLAVANGPQASGYNRAMQGHYPPGSTFKMVSTLALLRQGLTPAQTVRCPKRARVQGKTFTNVNNYKLGAVPFRVDFARSCNTAFVNLSSRLGDRGLTRAAATLGIGRSYGLGMPVASSNVPPASSPVDKAAGMIGQGRVVATPLAMANAVATVARGSYKSPTLVVKPRPTANPSAGDVQPLKKQQATTLQRLMRKVVTSGTGEAVAKVPGPPVAGKSGTAEYGTTNPPKTHAWFIGFQGDIAFAVFVENGDSGGHVAAPIAADFLTSVRKGGT